LEETGEEEEEESEGQHDGDCDCVDGFGWHYKHGGFGVVVSMSLFKREKVEREWTLEW
jgi:hypothetical protein